jgi:hypothetical protein
MSLDQESFFFYTDGSGARALVFEASPAPRFPLLLTPDFSVETIDPICI